MLVRLLLLPQLPRLPRLPQNWAKHLLKSHFSRSSCRFPVAAAAVAVAVVAWGPLIFSCSSILKVQFICLMPAIWVKTNGRCELNYRQQRWLLLLLLLIDWPLTAQPDPARSEPIRPALARRVAHEFGPKTLHNFYGNLQLSRFCTLVT